MVKQRAGKAPSGSARHSAIFSLPETEFWNRCHVGGTARMVKSAYCAHLNSLRSSLVSLLPVHLDSDEMDMKLRRTKQEINIEF
jgi:hypothetical protein